MGTLSEVRVVRLRDNLYFRAWAWSSETDTMEVFWYEGDTRFTHFFEPNGKQVGRKAYRISFLD